VMENLLMGAYLRRDDISRELDWVFSLFPRLKERQKQKAGTLSGGEQQMLAISRALMGKPRVILLDEPSLGLAPLLVLNIFETIKEINGQGVTILLVEQNAYMALQIAHRAYVIETGRVVMEGTGKELLNNDAVKKAYLGG
ncbi:MAG TPA: ATP-binding cassette domain-containing protein, partial [bacterium]|nr:ATP-binding cassette domain-containing protein [bacterium]